MTDLLDPANSEPSRSSILALFDPYLQRGTPPVVQELLPEWLDLAFAEPARIDEIIAAALAAEPNISERDFRRFIEDRARAVQSIAAFLVANMTFDEGEDAAVRSAELAANTLAYYMANEQTKLRLIEVFRAIGRSIAANTDGGQRASIRRSPLPPAAVAQLQAWLTSNLEELGRAAFEGRLLEAAAPKVLEFVTARSIIGLSDQAIVPRALSEWVAGRSFAVIFALLEEADVRAGRGHATIEDAVALCEGGFGYEVAMIFASLADLTEGLDTELHAAAVFLQKQVKYGLTDRAAIAFYEAGFADRYVAAILAGMWPSVADRPGVREVCRAETEVVRAALARVPSYFASVAAELGA